MSEMRIPEWLRPTLERAVKADASMGATAVEICEGWKAMDELRALLRATAAPTVKADQVPDDQAYDRNAERLTAEALGTGSGINMAATSIDELFDESPSLPAAGSAVEEVEVVAWVTPEKDRAITALTEAAAREDGGAMLSSVRPYSVPCMTVAQCLRMLDQLRAALSAQQSDPWAPSVTDYDRAIHRNPDAKAWADLFVATFPGQADKHDLMIGWFANAMMAMHDHLKAQQSAHVSVPRDLLADLISNDHDTRVQAERALYALLASHGRGESNG